MLGRSGLRIRRGGRRRANRLFASRSATARLPVRRLSPTDGARRRRFRSSLRAPRAFPLAVARQRPPRSALPRRSIRIRPRPRARSSIHTTTRRPSRPPPIHRQAIQRSRPSRQPAPPAVRNGHCRFLGLRTAAACGGGAMLASSNRDFQSFASSRQCLQFGFKLFNFQLDVEQATFAWSSAAAISSLTGFTIGAAGSESGISSTGAAIEAGAAADHSSTRADHFSTVRAANSTSRGVP